MQKLFLQHRYVDLPPRDVSGNGNDGIGHDLLAGGSGPVAASAGFNGASSWVEVPRSDSMNALGQVIVRVVIRVDPAAPATRLNLVEGFVSFALFANPDRSISFTIVDSNGAWRGCASPPGVVTPGTWQTVTAGHDGVSEARIGLGEQVVASANDVPGPVRSIGQLGVAIGRWPDAPAFQFSGHMSEVALYKYDPVPEMNLLFGADCVDREALGALLRTMIERRGQRGFAEWAQELQDVLAQLMQAVQLHERDVDAHRRRFGAVVMAVVKRDEAAFKDVFGALSKTSLNVLREPENAALLKRFSDLIEKMPLNDQERRALAHALCLDRLEVDAEPPDRPRGDVRG
jgi:hypothetical protein